MEKSGYKSTYYRLVTKVNLEKIKEILNEHGYYDTKTIEQIEYEEKDNLPYFFLKVNSAEHIKWGTCAMLDGIFIKISSIIRQWEGIFYLPILIIREIPNEKLAPFINLDMQKEHELHHLQYRIEQINKYPDYIEESRKYNAGSCTYVDIKKSIKFEVNKIFSDELPALISDFEKGDRNYFLYSDGVASVAETHDKNDFLLYNMAQYISGLRGIYIERFPENTKELSDYIAKEVNKQGEKLFGENTMGKLAFVLFKLMELADRNGKHFEIEESCL